MQENQIPFDYTAPYYKRGSITDQTKNIWMIFHGYGQLVEEFHKKFSVINKRDSVLIFPQGLSKFYIKGIDKNIGASWMTAYDRETEINNYLTYLNQIYNREIKPFENHVALNVLGFSQGVHTATRWIYRSEITYDKLVLWGAGLAHEVNREIVRTSFNIGKQYIVIGDQDRFINNDVLRKMLRRYDLIGFEYQLIKYQGMHDIYPEILADFI